MTGPGDSPPAPQPAVPAELGPGTTGKLSVIDRALLERERIRFVLALGRALHRYGTPAHRLEEALAIVCRRLN